MNKDSINKNYPLPYNFKHGFIQGDVLNEIDPTKIYGRPIKFDLKKENGKLINVYYCVFKDNFILGSIWGLISGYCTKSFFRPSKLTPLPKIDNTIQTKSSDQKIWWYFLKRSIVIKSRVIRRVMIAGILFDFVEHQASNKINHSRTNTDTLFYGLLACSVLYPWNRNYLHHLVYSTGLLLGYIIGAKIPPAFINKDLRNGENLDI